MRSDRAEKRNDPTTATTAQLKLSVACVRCIRCNYPVRGNLRLTLIGQPSTRGSAAFVVKHQPFYDEMWLIHLHILIFRQNSYHPDLPVWRHVKHSANRHRLRSAGLVLHYPDRESCSFLACLWSAYTLSDMKGRRCFKPIKSECPYRIQFYPHQSMQLILPATGERHDR